MRSSIKQTKYEIHKTTTSASVKFNIESKKLFSCSVINYLNSPMQWYQLSTVGGCTVIFSSTTSKKEGYLSS